MTDTQWADVSVWQCPVNDSYPFPFFSFRSNDGTYRDTNFAANRAWSDGAVASGKMFGYLVYYVYRPGTDSVGVLQSMVGAPNPRMAVMVDVENWSGQISGNQSGGINDDISRIATWLGDARRVVGYGNTSDLNSLWPQKPAGIRLVVASYGANPDYAGKFAHQYADNVNTSPFGPCDINSADGMSTTDLEAMFGFTGAPVPPPTPPPAGVAPPWPGRLFSYPPLTNGDDVRQWQQQMATRGWTIGVDGSYGSQSKSVCTSFQQEKGLSVDGVVGQQTWGAAWTAPIT